MLLPSLGNLRLGGKKPAATDLGVMGFEVHSGNTEGGMRNMDPASPYGWVNVAEALSQHGGRVPNAPSAVRLSQQPDAFDTGLNVALRFGATYALPDVATWPPGRVYAWSHMGGQYRNMNGSHAYGFFDQTTLQHMATNAPADLRAYQEFLGRMCAYVEDVIEEADDPTYRAPPGTPAEVVDFPQGLLNAEIAYPLFPNSGANEAAYPAEYAGTCWPSSGCWTGSSNSSTRRRTASLSFPTARCGMPSATSGSLTGTSRRSGTCQAT